MRFRVRMELITQDFRKYFAVFLGNQPTNPLVPCLRNERVTFYLQQRKKYLTNCLFVCSNFFKPRKKMSRYLNVYKLLFFY